MWFDAVNLLFLTILSLFRSLQQLLCGPPPLGKRGLSYAVAVNLPQVCERMGALPTGTGGGAAVGEGAAGAPANAVLAPFVATFPAIIRLFRSLDFPFPLLGAVHVRSTISLRAGSGPGAPASAAVRWEPAASRAVPRGVESDVVVALIPLAWVATHTFLFVGARLQRGEGAAAPAQPPPPPPPPPAGAATAPLPLRARSALPGAWAALTGDFNPIHTSAWAARLFGFKGGVVAHGASVLLLALRAARAAPARELTVRFLRPLIIPDEGCSAVWWDEAGERHVHVLNGAGKVCIAAACR